MLVDNQIVEGAVVDGPFISERLNISAERHYTSIVFYTDDSYTTVADPASGTVDLDASETGAQFGQVAVINAVDAGEISKYDRPLVLGSISNIKISFSSIVGATHFRVKISGFDNT